MTPCLVFVVPVPGLSANSEEYALRFLHSYWQNQPGLLHDTIIVSCGGPLAGDLATLLPNLLPDARVLVHDNSGWDIGAFQFASQQTPGRLLVFFGTSAYFPRPGWLARIVQSVERYPTAALWGSMQNTGVLSHNVYPHLRTTGFWIQSDLLNQYPFRVTAPNLRYPFEHGPQCLTAWVQRRGFRPMVVTHDGEYGIESWGALCCGFQRGDQSALLVRDRLCDPPYYHG